MDGEVEPGDRVALHLRELVLAQLAGVLDHRIGDADLADVVEPPTTLQPHPRALVVRRVAHLARDHQRVLGDALGVAGRVRILGVHDLGKRLERIEDDLLAILEQPRVVDRDRRLCRQLGDEVPMVGGESVAQPVVGEKDDAQRLAAERDRHAQHRPRIQRTFRLGLLDARLHHGFI